MELRLFHFRIVDINIFFGCCLSLDALRLCALWGNSHHANLCIGQLFLWRKFVISVILFVNVSKSGSDDDDGGGGRRILKCSSWLGEEE